MRGIKTFLLLVSCLLGYCCAKVYLLIVLVRQELRRSTQTNGLMPSLKPKANIRQLIYTVSAPYPTTPKDRQENIAKIRSIIHLLNIDLPDAKRMNRTLIVWHEDIVHRVQIRITAPVNIGKKMSSIS